MISNGFELWTAMTRQNDRTNARQTVWQALPYYPKSKSILVASVMPLLIVLLLLSWQSRAATLAADLSEVRPGPVSVTVSGDSLAIRWPDERDQTWIAEFSLDQAKPLISRVLLKDRIVLRNLRPQYWASTGKRRGRGRV